MRCQLGGLGGTAGNGTALSGGDRKASGTRMSFTRRWRQERDTEMVDAGIERGHHTHPEAKDAGDFETGGLKMVPAMRSRDEWALTWERPEELERQVPVPPPGLDVKAIVAPEQVRENVGDQGGDGLLAGRCEGDVGSRTA